MRQLAAYIREFLGIRRTHDQRADTVAIQAEVLRAGAGDQHFRQLGREQPHRPGVLLQAVAKALVGEVDQRQQVALAHDLQDLAPVLLGQVETGRVVGDKVGAQAQGSGAAWGLGRAGAVVAQQRGLGAEHQLADQPAERGVAVAANVGLGGLLFHQALLGELHGMWNRCQPLVVLIYAHAEVELVRVGILGIQVHQPEDRVAGHAANRIEMHYLRPSASLATSSVRAAMMKSLRCRPLMEWLHQVTVTLPHSVSRPGWWPSASEIAPMALVKARANLKFLNRKTFSNCMTPSRTSMFQSGICLSSTGSSSSLTCGASARQASQWAWFKVVMWGVLNSSVWKTVVSGVTLKQRGTREQIHLVSKPTVHAALGLGAKSGACRPSCIPRSTMPMMSSCATSNRRLSSGKTKYSGCRMSMRYGVRIASSGSKA